MPPTYNGQPPSLIDVALSVNTQNNNASPYIPLIEKSISLFSFNDRQISELEKAIRSQPLSKIWYDQRKGKITAFHFHEVHTKVFLDFPRYNYTAKSSYYYNIVLRQHKNVLYLCTRDLY